MRIRVLAWLAVALVALALGFAGCGSTSGNSSGAGGSNSAPTKTVHFAKTKFVLHMGLAFGAFHRYIYKPLKAGVFSSPLNHKASLVKAALATAFIIHELKIAYTDARASPTLSKVVSPVTAFEGKVTAMVAGLKAGHFDSGQISSAQSEVASIASRAGSAGASIKDLPVPAF